MAYSVFVDDNFHYMDESERYKLGEFKTLDLAISACRKIVDEFLLSNYKPGMAAGDLIALYKCFGEDPFVSGDGLTSVVFSAWNYAEERCRELCADESDRQSWSG